MYDANRTNLSPKPIRSIQPFDSISLFCLVHSVLQPSCPISGELYRLTVLRVLKGGLLTALWPWARPKGNQLVTWERHQWQQQQQKKVAPPNLAANVWSMLCIVVICIPSSFPSKSLKPESRRGASCSRHRKRRFPTHPCPIPGIGSSYHRRKIDTRYR